MTAVGYIPFVSVCRHLTIKYLSEVYRGAKIIMLDLEVILMRWGLFSDKVFGPFAYTVIREAPVFLSLLTIQVSLTAWE